MKDIEFQFFPRSRGLTDSMRRVVDCFQVKHDEIHSGANNLTSNEVLEVVRSGLEKCGFERVYSFLETMYVSSRLDLPLKGILLIGY